MLTLDEALTNVLAEVVLAVLITSFKFGMTDRQVVWNTSGVIYPSMSKDTAKPEMMLKVQAV